MPKGVFGPPVIFKNAFYEARRNYIWGVYIISYVDFHLNYTWALVFEQYTIGKLLGILIDDTLRDSCIAFDMATELKEGYHENSGDHLLPK